MQHPLTGWNRTKLKHLHCLIAIASHKHMGRAAAALGVSQPALSKTLAEFEDILGVPLFVRARNGVVPTAAGHLLLGYAGSSLRTLREGLDHASASVRPDAVVIAMGALPTVARTVAPVALRNFRRSWPQARLQVKIGVNTELLALLKRGELDLVLGRMAEPAEMLGLSYEHLYAEELVAVARPGHPLAAATHIEPQRLADYDLVLPPEGTAIRSSVDAFLIRYGVSAQQGATETISDSFAQAYVRLGDSIWFIAIGVVEQELAAGTLVRLACDTRHTTGSVGLTQRSDAMTSPAVRELMEAIRGVAGARRAPIDPP